MSNENTEMVQVFKNRNNSSDLFINWTNKIKRNIKCAVSECLKEVDIKVYIVCNLTKNDMNYIAPLCREWSGN